VKKFIIMTAVAALMSVPAFAHNTSTLGAGGAISVSGGSSVSSSAFGGNTQGFTTGNATSGVKNEGTSTQTYATNGATSGAKSKGNAGTTSGSTSIGLAGGGFASGFGGF
jgi:hypothetical protein